MLGGAAVAGGCGFDRGIVFLSVELVSITYRLVELFGIPELLGNYRPHIPSQSYVEKSIFPCRLCGFGFNSTSRNGTHDR